MKKIIVNIALILFCLVSSAQGNFKKVPQVEMEKIYREIKTPYKYGLILVGKTEPEMLDSPSVFRRNGHWYMTYIVFDGRGYETWLAKSVDILNWKTLGRIMSFTDKSNWDWNQKAGYIALQNYNWGGSYEWEPFQDKYWMSYLGGDAQGYEAGLLSIGMAFTTSDPSKAHEWQRLDQPVLRSTDQDARWWEKKTIYKSSVIWDKSQTLGHPFVMYYNAKGDSVKPERWVERIGMAVSDDMIHWQRFGKDPVLDHLRGITGDAVIQKIDDIWVMFYFGAFWADRKGAFNRFACSYDLVNWTDWTGENLIQSSENYDNQYAHKSFVVKWNGVVYHFYCAVNDKGQRGIAVATSRDMGKSKETFFKPSN